MSMEGAANPDVPDGRDSPAGNTREHPVALKMPGVDCVEKIVIILDLSPEMNSMHFRSMEKRTVIHLTKRALESFLRNKHTISKKHEFALMVFRNSPEWLVDFQCSPEDLITQLNHNFPVDSTPPEIDLGDVFDCLSEHVQLPKVAVPNLPPPYVVRSIVVYGRSHTVPVLNKKECASYKALLACPNFFLDLLYVHEKPSEDNKCLEIYNSLCSLDETENAYVLEVSTSMTRLLETTCILLAHPLQRAAQADASYTLCG